MVVDVRRRSTVAAALLVALLVVTGSASARIGAGAGATVLPTLYVSYAMNCTFAITDDSGRPVSSIAPGTYQVQITTPVVFADVDLSGTSPTDMTACKSFVQFQLSGPGVSLTTTLQDGDEDYGVYTDTFQAGGTYTAQDGNQPSVARVVFAVSATGTATQPTAPYTSTATGSGSQQTGLVGSNSKSATSTTFPLRGTLEATVSSAGTPKLTFKGKAVTTLKAGRYMVSVVDQSKKSGFILQESRKAATTAAGVSFVGKRTVMIDMSAGQWFFYPTFVGAKSYFLVTS